ncbi:hypothetical protein B0H67DRAFT_567979 [Lasiosphaeris hirsuta]|uniref:Uncharacterized protein n=1 Tax=Lasiosphaeris hirsuta TaxID=260670 RepID=A0AA40E6N8_9PEZI|nr:hypothetical protein B0H67DRAFT_567979 [Lasiosphaeris hirsuta]
MSRPLHLEHTAFVAFRFRNLTEQPETLHSSDNSLGQLTRPNFSKSPQVPKSLRAATNKKHRIGKTESTIAKMANTKSATTPTIPTNIPAPAAHNRRFKRRQWIKVAFVGANATTTAPVSPTPKGKTSSATPVLNEAAATTAPAWGNGRVSLFGETTMMLQPRVVETKTDGTTPAKLNDSTPKVAAAPSGEAARKPQQSRRARARRAVKAFRNAKSAPESDEPKKIPKREEVVGNDDWTTIVRRRAMSHPSEQHLHPYPLDNGRKQGASTSCFHSPDYRPARWKTQAAPITGL